MLKENIDIHLSTFGIGAFCEYAICRRINNEKITSIDE